MSKIYSSFFVATRPLLALCLALGVLLGLPSAQAGENKWTSQGPFSGAVTAIAVDQQTILPNLTVFAGIDGNGVYRSDDAGDSWTEQNGGLAGSGLLVQDLELVIDIAVEPTAAEPTILYAATNGGGIFKATVSVGGAPVAMTWTPANGTPGPTELGNLSVLSIEVDPNDPAILYAGTNGGGLFRSLNGGMDWLEINDGVGQRVVFDVEIPIPIQLVPVINEVDYAGGAIEYIELKGQPNTSFALSLVFYESFLRNTDPGTGVCIPAENFDDIDDAAAFVNVSGFFDSNGLFVLSDSAAIANEDQVEPAMNIADTNTVAIALHDAPGSFFLGRHASTLNLLDVVVLSTSVGNHIADCVQGAFGLPIDGNVPFDFGALFTISRLHDGGENPGDNFSSGTAPTPGQLNSPIGHLFASTDLNGVFRTDERLVPGRSPMFFPVNNGLTSDIVFAFAVDGSRPVHTQDPAFCGLLGQSTPYVGTANDGAFIGLDPCDLVLLEDWESFNNQLPPGTTLRAMEISPPLGLVPSMIFAGSEDGSIFRRVTTNTEWEEVFSDSIGGIMIDALEIYQRNATQMIFAGSGNDIAGPAPPPDGLGGGVFATVDSGANWFQTGPRVDTISGIFVEAVEIDPLVTSNLYAGTFGGGVFVSNDSGGNWTELNTGIPTSALDGISRFVLSLALAPTLPSTLYAGTDLDGVYKTTDSGANWVAVNTGIPVGDHSIHGLSVDPTDPDIAYAATGRLYKTINGGVTWTLVTTGFPTSTTILDVEIDPVTPTILYAATQNKGVYKTINSGASWADSSIGLTDDFIRSLAVDPNRPETVYAGTNGSGLFKSPDSGVTWLPVSVGLNSLFVLSIEIDALSAPMVGSESQTLYVGTETGGVSRSNNAGIVWSPFNTGLSNFFVLDVKLDPTESKIRYAGTFGGGVYDFVELERVDILPFNGLLTSEAGGQATFTVALIDTPISEVTMTLSSSNTNEGTVSPEMLLFTPANALLPQTVIITGVDDQELDSDQAYVIITDALVSFDTRFDGVDPIDVSVTNIALMPVNPGISVNPVASLFTTELGQQATFTVVLTSVPTGNVSIPVASSDIGEGTTPTTVLTFTPANAQTPQTVTVTGVDDGQADGDQLYSIVLDLASSSDPDYDGYDPADVSITNTDNGAVANSLPFETAILGATGQGTGGGATINSTVFIGAKFTLATLSDITSLGAHLVGVSGNIFVAIMPLNGGTDLPNTPFNPGEALFSTTFVAPIPSNEVSINTAFQLSAGRYGIVFGSGVFGATGSAVAPTNDTDIPTPEYFFSSDSGAGFSNGGFMKARMFINGSAVFTSLLFDDGFESGDTTLWTTTVP
jgi:hypothetical protein